MRKSICLICSLFLLFAFTVFCNAEEFDTEVTEVTSESVTESSSSFEVQLSENSSENETSVPDSSESDTNNVYYSTEIEALNEIYNQNIYIIFGLFCIFGALVAQAFSFWKW